MEIPDDRYYGIQTSRMVKVSGCAHLPVIFWFISEVRGTRP